MSKKNKSGSDVGSYAAEAYTKREQLEWLEARRKSEELFERAAQIWDKLHGRIRFTTEIDFLNEVYEVAINAFDLQLAVVSAVSIRQSMEDRVKIPKKKSKEKKGRRIKGNPISVAATVPALSNTKTLSDL